MEIAAGVVTTWMKLAIRDRIEPEVPDDLETEDDEPVQTAQVEPADGHVPTWKPTCKPTLSSTGSGCPKTDVG